MTDKPNNKDREATVFTQTRLRDLMICPRKEYYQYRIKGVGIRPMVPESYFVEGEFGHYALAYYYKNHAMLRDNMIKRIQKAFEDMGAITPEYEQELRQDLASMMGACNAYKQIYKDDNKKFEVLFIEKEFAIEIAGFIFRGKIDLGLKNIKDGTKGFMEHKFLSQFSLSNYTNLPLNIQQLIYTLGFHKITGEFPVWYMWNIIKKSQLRRKGMTKTVGKPLPIPEPLLEYEARCQAQYMEEPDKMFFRPPPRLVEMKALEQVNKMVEGYLIRWEADVGKTPLMNLSACEGKYNNACAFAPACQAFMSGKKDGWDAPECLGLYRLKNTQHPELEG